MPYALIVGASERDARTVAIRPYRGEQRKDVALDAFVAEVADEVRERRTEESRA